MIKRELFYISAVLTSAISTFFLNYYLSQKLSLSDYGIFSLLYGTIGILIPLIIMGQATSITSVFFSKQKRENKNISTELYGSYQIMLLSSLGFILVSGFLWLIFANHKISLIMALFFGLLIILAAFKDFFTSLFVMGDNYKIYFFSILLYSLIFTGWIILNPSIYGFIEGGIISAVSIIIIGYLFGEKKYRQNNAPTEYFSKNALFFLGFAAVPGSIIASANLYADRYLLGWMLSLKDVAIYSLASTISVGIGTVIINALLKPNIVPIMSALQHNDSIVFNKTLNKTYMVLILISILATISYYLIGKNLILMVFGEKYLPALHLYLPLFLSTTIAGASQLSSSPLIQNQKLYTVVILSFCALLCNILLMILFIPLLGLKGVIFAIFISSILYLASLVYFSKKIVNYIQFPYKFVLAQLALICISLYF